MAQDSSSKSTTLFFGAIFLFALLRAALIVNMGAGLLLLLPAVSLPVYYFGRMFFLSLSGQDNPPPTTPQAASRPATRKDRETQLILCVFFGGPTGLLCGAWLYNEATAPQARKPPAPPSVEVASVIQAAPPPTPTPTPDARPGGSLTLWYETLLLERRDLDLKNPRAIQAFNAHVHQYDEALAAAQRPPASQ